MTKAELVSQITKKTGIEKVAVTAIVEVFLNDYFSDMLKKGGELYVV